MDVRINDVQGVLKKYGQEHLLNHYETLDEEHKKELIDQIEKIDFELVKRLYEDTKKETKNCQDKITPIEYLDKYKI